MAYKVISVSLKNQYVIKYLEEFKKNGGNVSGLIESLLEQYFFGGNDKELLTKEMMLLIDIEKRIEEFEKWRQEILPELNELKSKLKEKQEEQKTEEELPLIKELREVVFEDLAVEGWDSFRQLSRRIGRDPKDAIMSRLSSWAVNKNISLQQAKSLLIKAFPELNGHLKSVLEGEL